MKAPHGTDGRDAVLSIGELSRRTGVSIATLQGWERRHGILRPVRTPGGQRAYRIKDVSRVRTVLDLTQRGWTLRAVAGRLDEGFGGSRALDAAAGSLVAGHPADAERFSTDERVWESAPHDHLSIDVEALLISHRALRRLLRIATPEEGVDVVRALVEGVGGEVGPARPSGGGPLDVDLSFGEGEPVFAIAEPLTLARMRLEAILPWLTTDARHLIERVRSTARAREGDNLRSAG